MPRDLITACFVVQQPSKPRLQVRMLFNDSKLVAVRPMMLINVEKPLLSPVQMVIFADLGSSQTTQILCILSQAKQRKPLTL